MADFQIGVLIGVVAVYSFHAVKWAVDKIAHKMGRMIARKWRMDRCENV